MKHWLLVGALLATTLPGSTAPAPRYRMVLLEEWDRGARSAALDINNRGKVVGHTDSAEGRLAVFWDARGVYRLETRFGKNDDRARAVNERGDVVGSAAVSAGRYQAYVWPANGFSGPLKAPAATAINEQGFIGGGSGAVGDRGLPFLWTRGTLRGLPSGSAREGAVVALNDRGAAVGALGPVKAVLWRGGAPVTLPTLAGGANAVAFGINNHGLACGSCRTGGREVPVLWVSGRAVRLGELPGRARACDVNDRGQVIGNTEDGAAHAPFLYDQGRLQDLREVTRPLPGWRLREVAAINDRGEIAATAEPLGSDGAPRAALLKPLR